jgi:hypothetical protein
VTARRKRNQIERTERGSSHDFGCESFSYYRVGVAVKARKRFPFPRYLYLAQRFLCSREFAWTQLCEAFHVLFIRCTLFWPVVSGAGIGRAYWPGLCPSCWNRRSWDHSRVRTASLASFAMCEFAALGTWPRKDDKTRSVKVKVRVYERDHQGESALVYWFSFDFSTKKKIRAYTFRNNERLQKKIQICDERFREFRYLRYDVKSRGDVQTRIALSFDFRFGLLGSLGQSCSMPGNSCTISHDFLMFPGFLNPDWLCSAPQAGRFPNSASVGQLGLGWKSSSQAASEGPQSCASAR